MTTAPTISTPSAPESIRPAKPRVASLDALRGLVMLLLISHSLGLEPFQRSNHPVMRPIALYFQHAWRSYGWLQGPKTVWDMIMPTFMFVMGASMFLSGRCRISPSNGVARIVLRALKRFAILYLLGSIIHGVQARQFTLDVFGVLPQIANIYLGTTLILLLPRKAQVAAVVTLLVGYACLFEYVRPPADFAAPGPYAQYAKEANIASYIDKIVFHKTHPNPFLSVVPFCAITMLGYWCGGLAERAWPEARKLMLLVAAGIVAVGLGWLLSFRIPFERPLMTVSFTIFSAGIVLWTFAAVHWVMDVKRWQRWAFPLVVIGCNSIVIYFIYGCTPSLPGTTLIFTQAIVHYLGPETWGAMFNLWVVTLLYFLLALWLYRNRLFIRV